MQLRRIRRTHIAKDDWPFAGVIDVQGCAIDAHAYQLHSSDTVLSLHSAGRNGDKSGYRARLVPGVMYWNPRVEGFPR